MTLIRSLHKFPSDSMRFRSLLTGLAVGLLLFTPKQSLAQEPQALERLCDTAFEDCRQPLLDLINEETVGIDVAFWFMQDTSYPTLLIDKHNSGVPVRVMVDIRATYTYPGTEEIINQLAAAGIPIIHKPWDCILHWKAMIFAGQNKVQFSGANYSPSFFVPAVPNENYIDEVIYFTDDTAIVNSFKRRYDDMWIDTRFLDYTKNPSRTRRYPMFPIHPDMNFPPDPNGVDDFLARTVQKLDAETQRIDIIMYRITSQYFTNATIDARNRGVPVRLLHEPEEYRNPRRPWDSWNVDRLFMAGVQIKMRKHEGLNHEKAVILHRQGMTIFGSSNWTSSSSNCQDEHNYFTTKPEIYNWFVSHFDRKWNSASENEPFVPLPPDPPTYTSPSDGATGQPTSMTLRWEGGRWAHRYDIYLGTNPDPPLIASGVEVGGVDAGMEESYELPALAPGTTYYWRVVGKTMANQVASGPVWSFTTAGSPQTPEVTSVSPNTGPTNGGTLVTIRGSNFYWGATVSFGGSAATKGQCSY